MLLTAREVALGAEVTSTPKTGADLFNKVASTMLKHLEEKGNLVISSVSLGTAMGMVYLGAKGDTEKQLKSSLYSSTSKENVAKGWQQVSKLFDNAKGVTIAGVNRIYIDSSLNLLPEYEAKLKKYYEVTAIAKQNFSTSAEQARETINTYVANETRNMIKDLLEEVDPSTKAILINAFYFKGVWSKKFDPNNTKEADFHVNNKKSVKVQMMYLKSKFRYSVLEEEGAVALELPYQGDVWAMVIILPDAGKDILEIEKKVYEKNIWGDVMFKGQSSVPRHAEVWLPRFKTANRLDMKETLIRMGNKHLFGASADLSGMTNQTDLSLSQVVQECIIEVNEEGTEAAAATAAQASSRMTPIIRPIKIDRPFIFGLMEKSTGLLEYSGRIVDPTKK